MHHTPLDGAVVFRSPDRDACLEMRLVLQAARIRAEIAYRDGAWLLAVDAAERAAALRELDAYRRENAGLPRRTGPPVLLLPGGGSGALAYAAVLAGIAALAGRDLFEIDWLAAGGMQAGAVMEGQWWRAFTALTLHLDARHLLANLAFGAVLGFFAAQSLGGGVAWLGILLAGGLGNALNAAVQDPRHAAVGASTAVFGALGILVSHALYHRRRLPGGAVRRWSPLVSGVLLLAYTGTAGERTDVLAHLTGFLSGLLMGAAGSLLPTGLLARRDVQAAAAISVVVILALSWLFAAMGGVP